MCWRCQRTQSSLSHYGLNAKFQARSAFVMQHKVYFLVWCIWGKNGSGECFSFEDWCPAVGTRWLLCAWPIMRENGWRKKREGGAKQWELKEDARGFMCNSSRQNWSLCFMSFASNFLKNICSVFSRMWGWKDVWLLENNLAYMEEVVLECNMAATITVLKVLESI